MHAKVRLGPFPSTTIMEAEFVRRADYTDSYCIGIRRASLTPPELFHAVFAHRPGWIRAILITRNWLASRAGLEAPSASEIMAPRMQAEYRVGDTIGAWPVFAVSDHELIAGRDNRHMDFRLSVRRVQLGQCHELQVSTACVVHNTFGRMYLFCVLPFHKRGLRLLLASASSSGRL